MSDLTPNSSTIRKLYSSIVINLTALTYKVAQKNVKGKYQRYLCSHLQQIYTSRVSLTLISVSLNDYCSLPYFLSSILLFLTLSFFFSFLFFPLPLFFLPSSINFFLLLLPSFFPSFFISLFHPLSFSTLPTEQETNVRSVAPC